MATCPVCHNSSNDLIEHISGDGLFIYLQCLVCGELFNILSNNDDEEEENE